MAPLTPGSRRILRSRIRDYKITGIVHGHTSWIEAGISRGTAIARVCRETVPRRCSNNPVGPHLPDAIVVRDQEVSITVGAVKPRGPVRVALVAAPPSLEPLPATVVIMPFVPTSRMRSFWSPQ